METIKNFGKKVLGASILAVNSILNAGDKVFRAVMPPVITNTMDKAFKKYPITSVMTTSAIVLFVL